MKRLLITGGAGFVGSNLAILLAARHPDWEVTALDNLYRKGSALNLPRLEEAGVEFVKGDVREPGRPGDAAEVRRDHRVLGRALGDERRRRRHRLPRPHQPHRRLQLPRAGAARRGLLRLPLDQPGLPGGAAGGPEAGGDGDALRARRRAGRPRRLAGRDLRGLPAGGRADALRRDQAGRRAAGRGVPRLARRPRRDRPLRRDRRPLADGKGRPGGIHPLDARPLLPQPALLHRVRRAWQAGARSPPRRGPGRPGRAAAARPRQVGRPAP